MVTYKVSGVVVFVLFCVSTGQGAGLPTELQGYWRLNGNPGDASGNARDLILRGNIGFASGISGSSLSLEADPTKFADRPADDIAFDFGANDFTIQAWVYYNTTEGEQVAIEKLHGYGGIGGQGWTLTKLMENRYQFASDTTSVNVYSSILTIGTNTWHQLVTRRHDDILEIWFDGEVVGSATIGSAAVSDTDEPLLLGRRNPFDLSRKEMDGRLDEVGIWGRALTDSEIAYLYNGGFGNPIPEPITLSLLSLGGLALIRRRRK